MSIESLFRHYPIDGTFNQEIKVRPEFKKFGGNLKPIVQVFYNEGREGLIELDRKLTKDGVELDANMAPTKTSRQLTKTENEVLFINRSAIFLACLIPQLEYMHVEGFYEPFVLNRIYNNAFEGTKWRGKLPIISMQDQKLTDEESTNLKSLVDRDKTFAGCLTENGIIRLPHSLQLTIISSGNMYGLQEILPQYKNMADALRRNS